MSELCLSFILQLLPPAPSSAPTPCSKILAIIEKQVIVLLPHAGIGSFHNLIRLIGRCFLHTINPCAQRKLFQRCSLHDEIIILYNAIFTVINGVMAVKITIHGNMVALLEISPSLLLKT